MVEPLPRTDEYSWLGPGGDGGNRKEKEGRQREVPSERGTNSTHAAQQSPFLSQSQKKKKKQKEKSPARINAREGVGLTMIKITV